jgi:hypothetical protein
MKRRILLLKSNTSDHSEAVAYMLCSGSMVVTIKNEHVLRRFHGPASTRWIFEDIFIDQMFYYRSMDTLDPR